MNSLIYEKIKEICERKGVSVASVEKEAGLKNGAISKWNKSMPLATNLCSVAKVLNVNIEELLGEE